MTTNIINMAGHSIVPVTIAQAAEHYLQRKHSRGAAANTIVAYGADLRDFAEFASGQGIELLGLVSDRVVDRWLDSLHHRGNAARSQARKLSVLSGLMHHAMREQWVRHNPTQDIAIRYEALPVIAPEMAPLIAMLEGMPTATPLDLRDRAMLRLALDGALRVGDVTQLNLFDPLVPVRSTVDMARAEVRVVGKGGRPAVVPINAKTTAWLGDYLAVREQLAGQGETALFVSRRGRRITRQQAHNRIAHWGKQWGMTLHFHLLRHRRIGDVIERLGVDSGQHLARHRKKTTTLEVYGAHCASVVRHNLRQNADLDAPLAAVGGVR